MVNVNKHFTNSYILERRSNPNEYGEYDYTYKLIRGRIFYKDGITYTNDGEEYQSTSYLLTNCELMAGDKIGDLEIVRVALYENLQGKFLYAKGWLS